MDVLDLLVQTSHLISPKEIPGGIILIFGGKNVNMQMLDQMDE